jgi:hypothetical protein
MVPVAMSLLKLPLKLVPDTTLVVVPLHHKQITHGHLSVAMIDRRKLWVPL